MPRLLLYTTQGDRRLQLLGRRLARERQVTIESCPDTSSLERGLRQAGGAMTLAVLLTASREELQELLTLRPLMADIPHILILPDRDKETVAMGHVLAPRFLTDIQNDFQEIHDVLSKMLEKYSDKTPSIES